MTAPPRPSCIEFPNAQKHFPSSSSSFVRRSRVQRVPLVLHTIIKVHSPLPSPKLSIFNSVLCCYGQTTLLSRSEAFGRDSNYVQNEKTLGRSRKGEYGLEYTSVEKLYTNSSYGGTDKNGSRHLLAVSSMLLLVIRATCADRSRFRHWVAFNGLASPASSAFSRCLKNFSSCPPHRVCAINAFHCRSVGHHDRSSRC